ncbi:beta-N-acetylhexosaminidase [Streptomyces sp. NPDC014870]|uniref:beta-N-acetylhexosaminidase n=1 Tax=Streptomyces sp. NPDC014870 TaxID=3364925 RepID=UPI0036FD00C7
MSFIPKPRTARAASAEFVLDATTCVNADPVLARPAHWLREAIRPATGYELPPGKDGIRIALAEELGAESYRMSVRPDAVTIEAGGPAGAFYGAQTLRQLLPADIYRTGRIHEGPWRIPAMTVEDAPRFRWRGALIDVARHFMPKNDLLRYIDLLAMHKLNVLHLHLTDDQGWRMEIKRYPRLTEVGAWRQRTMIGNPLVTAWYDERPHGGYYTQDDLREIVAYAADRFVTVVPEIDLPGHVQAAIAAYPELGVTGQPVDVGTQWGVQENLLNAEETTVTFFRHVFDEVLQIFPSPYICVGGDEVVPEQWRADPRTRQRRRELGLPDESALHSWYIKRFDDYLTARGRRLYGWDEILEGGLAKGATVASWRGTEAAVTAARMGHEVVTCPQDSVYLDHRQDDTAEDPSAIGSPTTVADVYGFDPVPRELTGDDTSYVIGAQCALWTEHIDSVRNLDYQAFPRLSAFAETVWSGPERDFADFSARLAHHLRRLDALGVEYRPADGPRPWQRRPDRRAGKGGPPAPTKTH